MAVPPKIDGTVNDQEWAGASTAARQLVVIKTSQPSGDKGQFWIGYDEHYLYVGVRTFLKDPKRINDDEFRQNVSLRGNDAVGVYLDAFGNAQDINEFTFNPAGATNMQLAGGRASKLEWSGQFEAAGRKTSFGWEGEARIAWDVMTLPDAGTRDMKILIDWYVSSSQQGVSTHSLNDDFSRMHVLNGVEVPRLSRAHKFLLLPYAYAGIDDDGDHIANGGLDVKTTIQDQLSLIGTFNPDFRNIENDILNLDFSNFERLADEARPFFLEGREYLQTLDVNDRTLFASQRVGSFDVGLKVYGNLTDRLQIGTLAAVDHGVEQTVVGTLGYSPDNLSTFKGSFVGLDREGEENKSFAFDGVKRIGDTMYIGSYMQSDDEVDGFGAALNVGGVYRSSGKEIILLYEGITPDFNPRAGYAPQKGYKGFAGVLGQTFSATKGLIRRSEIKATYINYDLWDGGNYDELSQLRTAANLANGLGINLDFTSDHYLDFYNTFYSLTLALPKGDPYRMWQVSQVVGTALGQEYQSTMLRVLYRPIKRLQLDLRHQSVRHLTNDEQTVFSANWIMDRYRSVAGRLVKSGGDINWFLSYKMSGNAGAEYFLILGDPNAETFQKSLVFKVSVPLTVK